MDFNNFDILIELAASGGRAGIDPMIFAEVFRAWTERRTSQIHYHRVEDGAAMDLFAEPHILKMRDGVWYIKCRLISRNTEPVIRTLALHRISEIYPTNRIFERDLKLDNADDPHDIQLFALPRHSEVKLHLKNTAVQYALEYLPPGEFEMNGIEMTLTLHDIEDYRIRNFVLLSGGNATVIYPAELRSEIISDAQACLDANSFKNVVKSRLKRLKNSFFGKLF